MSDNLPEQLHAPSRAVATTAPSADNSQLDASDIRLPRLKVAQYLSKAVTNELVEYGSLYLSTSKEDPEPIQLTKPGKKIGDHSEGLRFYILGVRKGFSYTDPNGELGRTPDGSYPDLSLVKGNDPRNVRRTYDYTIVIPSAPELPAMFLMHGAWGGQSAKAINTRLLLAQQAGRDPQREPFVIKTEKTENAKGPFARAIVVRDDVPAKDLEADAKIVDSFLDMVKSGRAVADDEAAVQSAADNAPSLA